MSLFFWKMSEHSVGAEESCPVVGVTVVLRHGSPDSSSMHITYLGFLVDSYTVQMWVYSGKY